ncbi:MarR family winged helix-turn-helix transcriptional regulator [Pseudomonas sp. MT3]|uniref:MarR family winged helix-turn-helix transcriptional regulator n=1 Tax=Pseudomonas sp. ATCC 13867 TaxID=1294143 RepID=UPI0005A0AF6E|nr:MarR family transcriptional regulator [Pseudomonas sp. ATCC 13867]
MTHTVNPELPQALMKVFDHMRESLQDKLCAEGIDLAPPDIRLLELIGADAGQSLQCLGRKLCRDKALVTRKIREMEALGLVRRERNPDDQRSFQLFLTEAGRSIETRTLAILARTHDDLFAPLDDAQQQMLTHLLQQCLPDRTA